MGTQVQHEVTKTRMVFDFGFGLFTSRLRGFVLDVFLSRTILAIGRHFFRRGFPLDKLFHHDLGVWGGWAVALLEQAGFCSAGSCVVRVLRHPIMST